MVDAHDNLLPPDSTGELVVRPRSPHTIKDGYGNAGFVVTR